MNAAILAAILAGHLIGDWIIQTDRQAAGKGWDKGRLRHAPQRPGRWWPDGYWSSWTANQAHMLSYHAALVAAVAPFWWDPRLAVLAAVSWVTHSFIDRRWPVKWLMARTGSRPFADTTWGPIVVDQALHFSILLLTTAHLLG